MKVADLVPHATNGQADVHDLRPGQSRPEPSGPSTVALVSSPPIIAEVPATSWEQAVIWFRDQPQYEQIARDAFYDDPLLDAAARYRACVEWRAVAEILRGRSGKALDVGAGRGIASYALARDGFQVTALEPDPGAVVGSAAIRQLA